MTALDHHLAGLDPWRRELLLRAARGDRAARLFFDPAAGMVNPDPWQRRVAVETVTKRLDVLLNCSRQAGKALDVDTPIPTPTGWTTMGELRVGDQVYDERGVIRNITFVSDVKLRKCYEVKFSDGSSIVADGEHEWMTLTAKCRAAVGRTVGDVPQNWTTWKSKGRRVLGRKHHLSATRLTTLKMLETISGGSSSDSNHAIPAPEPLSSTTRIDHPYLMGVWLGDGTSSAAYLTIHDDDREIIEEIEKSGWGVQRKQYGASTPTWMVRGGFSQHLRDVGVLNNKHIPRRWLRACVEDRLALLQGLMDTDGYVADDSQCELTLCNERLALGAAELVRSLGMTVKLREDDAKISGRVVGRRWRINFLPNKFVPFRLSRKMTRVRFRNDNRLKRRLLYVRSIEPVGERWVKCVQTDGPSHLYLAGNSMVPTHNTETLSYCNYLLASLGMFAVIVLPTDEQSKEFLRIVMEHHNRLHLTALSKHRDPNMHEVNFSSGGRIIALPNSEKRVRMYRKVDQLTIDEASRVPDPIYNALRPVLMVGRGCTALASTPNGRSGFFYEEWIGEGSAADPHGGPWRRHRISWRDVGCHPDGTPRLRPQDLERERQRPGVIVEQEYLDCTKGEEFLAGGSCPFDSELWEAIVENNVWGDD